MHKWDLHYKMERWWRGFQCSSAREQLGVRCLSSYQSCSVFCSDRDLNQSFLCSHAQSLHTELLGKTISSSANEFLMGPQTLHCDDMTDFIITFLGLFVCHGVRSTVSYALFNIGLWRKCSLAWRDLFLQYHKWPLGNIRNKSEVLLEFIVCDTNA